MENLSKLKSDSECNHFKELFNLIPDSIIIHDQEGQIMEINKQACRILGYSGKELSRMNICDIETGYSKAELKDLWSKIGAKPKHITGRFMTKDKSEFPVEIIIKSTLYKNNKSFIILAKDKTNEIHAKRQTEFIDIIYHAADDISFVLTDLGKETPKILDFSPGAERIFGYKKSEVIGKSVNILRPPGYAADSENITNTLKNGQKYFKKETTFLRKSGEYFQALLTVHPIKNDSNEIIAGLGVTLDITNIKKKEEIITESKERYKLLFKESEQKALINRLLLESARFVLESKDFKTTARYIFDACRKATGAKSGYVALLSKDNKNNEVLFLNSGGLPCTVDPSLPMSVRGLRAEAYKSGKAVYENDFENSEWIKLMPEGHVNLKNVMFAPINIDLKTVGVIGLANKPEDFTDEDAAVVGAFGEFAAIALKNSYTEEQLIKQKEFADTIIETAQVIVITLDKNGNIERINPFLEKLSGYKEDEVRGKNWFKTFIPEDWKPKIEKIYSKAVSGDKTIGNINPIKLKSGEFRDIIWYDSHIKDNNGNITGILAVGQDITDQLKIEEKLRQSEKMEAIGSLAGGIAHDFNNILSGIIGYSELSLNEIKPGSVLENNINQILKASNRAKNLVKQILTFTRQNMQEMEALYLAPVIKEAVTLLKASIPASVSIQYEIKNETKPVLSDSTKLHELILNIAANSVYAMEQKGVLFIQLYEETISENITGRLGDISEGQYSVIEITDTGCGMDEKTIKKIFDPFFTTKPVGKGTGMGLSVVFGIVQSHNGNIIVDSTPGKGTTFTIYLPQTEAPVTEETEELSDEWQKGSESVLFVDDEEILAEVGKNVLNSLGYTVSCFTSSEKALNSFRKNPEKYDLLITDQTMPLMTGLELTEEVLKIKKDIPIIICTGYNTNINPEKARNLGIRKFFMKPFSWQEMSKAIRDIIKK